MKVEAISDVAARWSEAAETSQGPVEWLEVLLRRDEAVRVFCAAYNGARTPDRVAECARAAGLGLDDLDLGLVAAAVASGWALPERQ